MGSVLYVDESKGNNIFIFAGIIINENYPSIHLTNQTYNLYIEEKLQDIFNEQSQIFGKNFKEIHSKNINAKNFNKFKILLNALLSFLDTEIKKGNIKIVYNIFHENHTSIENFSEVIKAALKSAGIREDDTNKILNAELYRWLIKEIHKLPINGTSLKTVIADNRFDLKNSTSKKTRASGNIYSYNIQWEELIAITIQSAHQVIQKEFFPENETHEGLEKVIFKDSKSSILLMISDILSNFMYNSIKYLYLKKTTNIEVDKKIELKFNFLSQYIDLNSFPINKLNLSIDKNDNMVSNISFSAISIEFQ
jgi:hypothetical protein